MTPDRLRVLFFAPTLGDGGADRVVIALLRHLDRSRFRPALAVMRREGALAGEVPADVELHELGTPRLAVSAPALARVVRATRADVVFSTHGGSNIIAALAHALARSRARLILSERSALVRADRSALRRALEIPAKRWTYRRADLVTAVSAGVARQLASLLRLAEAKIRVVYNPMVDDELGARAAERVDHPWFGETTPVIVAVGRLVAIKDYPTLLRAFAAIRAARPARLVVLGDGPLRGE
ncbi:MAG TPA: glycosyltransferase, partial [Kofleriaceae bacterium]|nr:glycosyltransferase [Kofleriaceae bacterium]